MDMQTKSAAVEFKTNSTPGEFTAVISAIGNVDRDKDRVMPGAFKSAMDEDPIPPVYWAHQHLIPPIGDGINWAEKGINIEYEGALFVKGDDEHPYAKMVYAGMKSRDGRPPAINQFSYTYGVPADGSERVVEDGKSIRNLHVIRPVLEVGPCFLGANPDTALVAPAKSLDVAKLVSARKNGGRTRISMKQLLSETLGLKDYGDIDGYEIRMLLDMIDSAVSFIQFSDEDDDVVAMQGVASTLLGMLTAEFAEVTQLMAQGDAINAILNDDLPSVDVSVTVETASAEETDLDGKTAAVAVPEAPAEAAPEAPAAAATGETETPPAGESAAEAATTETTDAGEADAVVETPAENEPEAVVSDDAVSSDDASTVSNEEVARLVLTWPSH